MTTHGEILDLYEWWSALKHGGLLVAPSKLAEFFAPAIPPLEAWRREQLRRAVLWVEDDAEGHLGQILDVVLETVLELPEAEWQKGTDVDPSWSREAMTGEKIKPRRVWSGPDGGRLPVFVADASLTRRGGKGLYQRIGVGRGRRAVSRVVEWMRKTGSSLALLTNGRQWRLIHAGTDYNAWCEWDTELWFEQGEPSSQVAALRILIGRASLEASGDEECRLVQAILASRRGQAELSSVLGERVRRAVEELVRSSSEGLDEIDAAGDDEGGVSREAIFIAASRIVMRLVVVLFAESRDLLPRENPIYHGSYGLQGLRERLDRAAGGRSADRLRHQYSAWPRLLSLFDLIFNGSAHPALPILRYGGELFRSGNPDSKDPVRRALAALESTQNHIPDSRVHRILHLLTRSKVRVRQGNRSIWVEAPVDFSDLSTEYVGILYEGLLDFELRRAVDAPVVFLNVGDQPALPFERLDAMTLDEMKEILDKLGKTTKKGPPVGGAEEADDDGEAEEREELEEEAEAEEAEDNDLPADEGDEMEEDDDIRQLAREMVQIWAEKAVKAAGIISYPKDDTDPLVRDRFTSDVEEAATRLVARIVMPGEWYLVRWGGTRKGSGTFYTRPQLAGPITRRTLRPLVYQKQQEREGEGDRWVVRPPEEILSLKACDPAMGSGAFLVAALRFLVDALVESLHVHGRLETTEERTVCRLADGLPSDHPSQEIIPQRLDHPDFEDRLRARLRRHVVERCIYGVDLNPLAVELGRMALWIETMDPRLPFGFLDHKLKVGNSLVGAWFDRLLDYPALCCERSGGDAGDKAHNGVSFEKDARGQALKDFRNDVVKPELRRLIQSYVQLSHDRPVDPSGLQERHEEALEVFRRLHDLPVHEVEERSHMYREEVEENPALQSLKDGLDAWCAVWFWPADDLEHAPTPLSYLKPEGKTAEILNSVRGEHRFFHWEFEFPDVFDGPGAGFDVVIGNPPWETMKPSSKEFFSNVDPLYRTYGKQEALGKQKEYFRREPGVEHDWLDYRAGYKSLSNWVRNAAHPFGDGKVTEVGEGLNLMDHGGQWRDSRKLHNLWGDHRSDREGYADPAHPFRHQGSADLNTYKMFLEVSHALLRDEGRLGFLVPSGIYTDQGTSELRTLFLERCSWEWLFGFENREKIFDIDGRAKFCPIIVEKGGETTAILTSFMHRSLQDWQDGEAEKHVLPYPASRVLEFSPESKAILEIRGERDLAVLTKLYKNGVLLGDDSEEGWGLEYSREFDMTTDSKLFPPLPKWEADGYRPDEYGHWLKGGWREYSGPHSILERNEDLVLSRDGTAVIPVSDIEDVALPLYEGRMIGQFDFSEKGWVSGRGRSAEWRELSWEAKTIEPQYLMSLDIFSKADVPRVPKAPFMPIGSATNSRTAISGYVGIEPAGNSVVFLVPRERDALSTTLLAVAAINSFSFDFLLRKRLGGLNLNWFLMAETALPHVQAAVDAGFREFTARLSMPHVRFAHEWLVGLDQFNGVSSRPWRTLWALTEAERIRIRAILDALVAFSYGLDEQDLAWVLKGCDHSAQSLAENEFTRTLNPKGFWRVQRELDPELRITVLTQIAFEDLQRKGISAFLAQNDGEGWMLPDTLRLADFSLGHDERAKVPQPVGLRLGARYFAWQMGQKKDESWSECELHADLIQHIKSTRPFYAARTNKAMRAAESAADYPDLFGEPVE